MVIYDIKYTYNYYNKMKNKCLGNIEIYNISSQIGIFCTFHNDYYINVYNMVYQDINTRGELRTFYVFYRRKRNLNNFFPI